MKTVKKLLKLRETTAIVLWFYAEAIQGRINEENGNKNGLEIIKNIEKGKHRKKRGKKAGSFKPA